MRMRGLPGCVAAVQVQEMLCAGNSIFLFKKTPKNKIKQTTTKQNLPKDNQERGWGGTKNQPLPQKKP